MENTVMYYLLLLVNGAIWFFQLSIGFVDARLLVEAPLSSLSVPPFNESMAAFSPGIAEGTSKHHMFSNRKMVIAFSTALGAIIVLFSLLIWFFCRKNLRKSHSSVFEDGLKGLALSQFVGKYNSFNKSSQKRSVAVMEFKMLEVATNNFRESEILGQGGFGRVYRAQFDDKSYGAVKRLDGGTQDAKKEFETEVALLSKIQHPNIIILLGYCIHEETKMLVYELMESGSLDSQLHGTSHGAALTWHIRLKIALDTAKGLEYLHEHCNPPVIHRDLKSSNILLDSNLNAKLSDFGLAIQDGLQNRNNIKLSGTLGYVAPEYLLDGKLTDKSDVYAFGVVLLELLLGRKPLDKQADAQSQSIVTWALPQLTDRSKLPNIVDPVIKDTMDLKHLYQVAAVAVLCVQPEPSYRPLITDVLHSLIPLVPMELGGTLRLSHNHPSAHQNLHQNVF
ncbi:hypothetical protein LIER_18077 [Lithospermum erythrorhizon]|uniref:Protein kinase domain-containing protein n=1 Tax=Lithospermum erythrorhizon TaxID=34254 RepID=A0AAV3QH39_LITER